MSAVSVFDNLIDQEHVISILRDAVSAASDSNNESQEMTHAWLLLGRLAQVAVMRHWHSPLHWFVELAAAITALIAKPQSPEAMQMLS